MLSGRHFILLGIIACAGLLSVHDGQQQIDACYKIAAVEKDLRALREEIELYKVKHQALQSPKAVTTRAAQLKLPVAPISFEAPTAPPETVLPLSETTRSLGSAQGARRAAETRPAPIRPAPAPSAPSNPTARN